MEFDAQLVFVQNCQEAEQELVKINCDRAGIRIMTDKLVFKAVKLEKIPAKAANLLKQTFLAKGGEVAVAKGSADLSVEYTDVLIFATLKQYKLALPQLKMQPWGLSKVAETIEQVLLLEK
jgi:dihydropteroate synthase